MTIKMGCTQIVCTKADIEVDVEAFAERCLDDDEDLHYLKHLGVDLQRLGGAVPREKRARLENGESDLMEELERWAWYDRRRELAATFHAKLDLEDDSMIMVSLVSLRNADARAARDRASLIERIRAKQQAWELGGKVLATNLLPLLSQNQRCLLERALADGLAKLVECHTELVERPFRAVMDSQSEESVSRTAEDWGAGLFYQTVRATLIRGGRFSGSSSKRFQSDINTVLIKPFFEESYLNLRIQMNQRITEIVTRVIFRLEHVDACVSEALQEANAYMIRKINELIPSSSIVGVFDKEVHELMCGCANKGGKHRMIGEVTKNANRILVAQAVAAKTPVDEYKRGLERISELLKEVVTGTM